MYFLQTVATPFMLGILGEDNKPKYFVHVPRYTLEDAITWGAELAERWRQQRTDGMTDNEVRNFNLMHPPYPLTPEDLKLACQSMEGAKEIIKATFPNARVFSLKAKVKLREEKAEKGKKPQKFRDTEWVKDADVTTPEILREVTQKVLDANGAARLSQIAFEIADLFDLAPRAPKIVEDLTDEPQQEQSGEEKAKGSDPLPVGGKQD